MCLDKNRLNELPDNAMLKVKPELYHEWDFEKNGHLNIWEMTKSSGMKVWWNGKCGHSWDSVIASRSKGVGCPYCRGLKTEKKDSISVTHPHVSSEWNYEKNKNLTIHPSNIGRGSNKRVWWKCCKCDSEWDATIEKRCISNRGCPYCANLRVNSTNCLATKNPKLASEWHPTLNDKTPYDVPYGTNKKYWWKCKLGHEWESVLNSRNSGVGCPYCSGLKTWRGFNDMWTTNPELASLLANPEDGYKYSKSAIAKLEWKCSTCGYMTKKKVSEVNVSGICCINCHDGFSYPHKFMKNILSSINVEFESEVSYSWSDSKRYDFYIPSLNTIIETHGEQHYKETGRRRTLKEEQKNDEYKRRLAKENGISLYVELDCRVSDMEWIKNSVMNSELVNNLPLGDLDWRKIAIESEKSLVLEAWDMFKKGMKVVEVHRKLKVSNSTSHNYFKKGKELGLIN